MSHLESGNLIHLLAEKHMAAFLSAGGARPIEVEAAAAVAVVLADAVLQEEAVGARELERAEAGVFAGLIGKARAEASPLAVPELRAGLLQAVGGRRLKWRVGNLPVVVSRVLSDFEEDNALRGEAAAHLSS
jgi:hypothetical protein